MSRKPKSKLKKSSMKSRSKYKKKLGKKRSFNKIRKYNDGVDSLPQELLGRVGSFLSTREQRSLSHTDEKIESSFGRQICLNITYLKIS